MNSRTHLLLLFIVILMCTTACTTTQGKKQKRATAYRELAEAYMAERQYTVALQELLKAEKLDPDNALIQNDLGLVHLVKERTDLSVKHLKRAIAIKPDYAEAINNLATALLQKKEWDEAIFYLNQLTGNLIYTTPQYALLNLGWAYFNKQDYIRAEKYYKLAIKHYQDGFPKDISYIKALGGLGRTYTATGDLPKALSIFSRAVKFAPSYPQTYFFMAQAYEKAGRPQEANIAYLKVIEIAPDSEIANLATRAAFKLQ